LKLPDPASEGFRYGLLIGAFVVIALLAAIDLATDLDEGVSIPHVLAEGAVIVIAFAAIAWLVSALLQRNRELDRRLASSAAAAQQWRDEAQTLLEGLGASIDRQFSRWQLSAAEKEVALLLLKGLAHKHIARTRGISEATARQQAISVYRKAGVAGRNDLAAFFLEDLALPAHTSTEARRTFG
jgi:DNA-binding CsgD family transcriptional regulator